ncbi:MULTISPECIES: ABC transporter permease [Leptolyngbya]|uniref:ABC-2 family transporter protein n=1 Tax=Leptolyngbya boryana CZ1 TaxID=3060204 RepID=A0AA97APE0_LEPBY|nr:MULTISPECIES: ABC-2 family transporter protein [Leptolyngbya]MCY6491778.1 ABC-2 family transporter protein [Leptolyngbya sp. GGD]WNZ44814.1 ABC-2 family transporter protein [Leptolyngbya boryana CZ1]
MNALQLYLRYISVSFQAQMQYKVSFLLQLIGQFGGTAIEFFAIWTLFNRFNQLGTWTLAEVALFYGTVNTAFACADAIARGFDLFGKLIRDGGFDRLLLRPRSTVLQLLGTEFTLKRMGRLLQGLAVLGWSLSTLQIPLSLSTVWLLFTAWLGSIALFVGIVIVQATLTFWTIESLEIMNILTYGGVETAQYPFSIYRKWFQRFFTFLIPLACVSYFPLLAVLNKAAEFSVPLWVCYVSPIAGFIFLGVSLKLWRIGERYYCSTGS